MSLESIPTISKETLATYLKGEALSLGLPSHKELQVKPEEILGFVEGHVEKAVNASKQGLTDVKTAKKIFNSLNLLFTHLIKVGASDEVWYKFILVAIYFVQENDEENDFTSPVGFDDDAEIVNLFLESLGYPIPKIILS